MDGLFSGLIGIVGLIVVAVLAVALFVYLASRRKVADANQALVITGGKGEPKILVGGGAFVPPFRKGSFFDLGLKTVSSTNEATHTNTMIPVVVEWTAQLRADTSKDEKGQLNESLRNAILGFTNYEGKVTESLQQTLEGEVRAVIAKMTPEDLVRDKAKFATDVDSNVRDSMAELGFKLVSLNIGKITDPNGYYDNLAASDREAKRSEAANLKANADQSIAVRRAESDKESKGAEQTRDLAVAEQERTLVLRRTEIKSETDVAQANAQIAGQLQTELRNKELAARRGEVKVIEVQQEQAAAEARREVELTDAETRKQREAVEAEAAKQQSEIAAGAEARRSEIAAEAAATVAQRQATSEATAAEARAKGVANAKREEASAEADAINRTSEAHAEQVRRTGLAQAEVTRAQGEAEAAATLAKGEAEAEVQRKMAEALAANDGANLRVTLAEIQRDTTVKVYTTVGEAMARIGEHATFIDMGGTGSSDGDLLSSVLGNVPEMLKKLDVKSGALSGLTFGDSVGSLISSVTNSGTPQETAEVPAIETAPSVEESTTDPVEFSENGQESAQV